MALASSLCAQSLFDLLPAEEVDQAYPLTWTAGLNIGYDDNANNSNDNEDSSLFGNAYVGAAFVSTSPQTTTTFGAQVGVIHYFDDVDRDFTLNGISDDSDQTSFTASVYLNLTHRISERLRFVSNNSLAYELEPDYTIGIAGTPIVSNYFRYYTDQAIGYRWTERLATYSGFRIDGITYDDLDNQDRFTWSLYHNFRYQLTQQTVATLNYRYSETEGDGPISDSTNQFVTAGIEHRFSPRAVAVVRAGVQIRDVDGGESGTSPFGEASINVQANEQFSWRGFARYSIEDYQRSPRGGGIFSDNQALRLGVSGTYQVSQPLALIGGVNYINYDYEDGIPFGGVTPGDVSEDLINAYIGFNLALTDSLSLNGRYNYTDFSSDIDNADYQRNRFSLGVSTTF